MPVVRAVCYTVRSAVALRADLGRDGFVAVEEPTFGCTCCANVLSKDPLKYEYVNQRRPLKNKTQNKHLTIYACPKCDEPLIANAERRAGKGLDE